MKKTKNKHIILIAFMAIVLIVEIIMLTIYMKHNRSIEITKCEANITNCKEIDAVLIDYTETITAPVINSQTGQVHTEESLPTVTPAPTNNATEGSIGQITIETSKKTRTFDIMPDVSESTLKNNIGYLPSSSYFGEEGLCVLMGHRDTDFSVLKYVEICNKITIQTGCIVYAYEVSYIEIVDSDKELKFKAKEGSNLVLVTCYPFYYNGHAPQKFVVYAQLKQN